MIRLPVLATEENRVIAYNLYSRLKESGLMDEKNRFTREISTSIEHYQKYGLNAEIHCINQDFMSQNLSEIEYAILFKLHYCEGTLSLIGNQLTIEIYS